MPRAAASPCDHAFWASKGHADAEAAERARQAAAMVARLRGDSANVHAVEAHPDVVAAVWIGCSHPRFDLFWAVRGVPADEVAERRKLLDAEMLVSRRRNPCDEEFWLAADCSPQEARDRSLHEQQLALQRVRDAARPSPSSAAKADASAAAASAASASPVAKSPVAASVAKTQVAAEAAKPKAAKPKAAKTKAAKTKAAKTKAKAAASLGKPVADKDLRSRQNNPQEVVYWLNLGKSQQEAVEAALNTQRANVARARGAK